MTRQNKRNTVAFLFAFFFIILFTFNERSVNDIIFIICKTNRKLKLVMYSHRIYVCFWSPRACCKNSETEKTKKKLTNINEWNRCISPSMYISFATIIINSRQWQRRCRLSIFVYAFWACNRFALAFHSVLEILVPIFLFLFYFKFEIKIIFINILYLIKSSEIFWPFLFSKTNNSMFANDSPK